MKLHAHMLDDMVHMVVVNGDPIPSEMMEKIFDDGTSDNPINNLSVSRSLIRQQGGDLELTKPEVERPRWNFKLSLKSSPGDEPPA